MRCVAFLAFLFLSLSQLGCAYTSASGLDRVAWAPEDAKLGQVALLIRIDHHAHERDPDRKDAEVRGIVHEIMRDHPTMIVVDEEPIQSALRESKPWHEASEHEIIEAARTAGLDTVGLITFDRYGGVVSVLLLPPGWTANTYVYYRFRLLDVATGRVIADLGRYRRTSGYLSVRGRHWLPRDLKDDLAAVLARESAG